MKRGFTVIEVLIVIVILAILTATLVPYFTGATTDAQGAAALTSLRHLREQIMLYRNQHNGIPPASLSKLLVETDEHGNPGAGFGPYIVRIPANPFTNSDKATIITVAPPTTASGTYDRGWLYHPPSGNIWLDESGYIDK